jgi:hypothetical protein
MQPKSLKWNKRQVKMQISKRIIFLNHIWIIIIELYCQPFISNLLVLMPHYIMVLIFWKKSDLKKRMYLL